MKNLKRLAILLPMIFAIGCSESDTGDITLPPSAEDNLNEHNHVLQIRIQNGIATGALDIVSCANSRDITVAVANNILPPVSVFDTGIAAVRRILASQEAINASTRYRNILRNQALPSAIRAFNNVGQSRLRFRMVNPNENPDIMLRVRRAIEDGTLGTSNFPLNGRPGNEIIFNAVQRRRRTGLTLTEQQGQELLTPTDITGILIHEMMHAIGFGHNSTDNPVLQDQNSVEGLFENLTTTSVGPVRDPGRPGDVVYARISGTKVHTRGQNSFMDDNFWDVLIPNGTNVNQVNFRQNDRVAIRRLYGNRNIAGRTPLCTRWNSAGNGRIRDRGNGNRFNIID